MSTNTEIQGWQRSKWKDAQDLESLEELKWNPQWDIYYRV
jgi:hypothetical protein